MADPVFERYKEALKQGHVAVFKGRPKEALAHYQEAAKLAGHRPLPFLSMGSVLSQMGRHQEAIAAYDEALRRAPDERQALSGKASALLAAGKRNEAANLLQRVAELEAEENRAKAEAVATAQAAAWSGGPERLLMAAEDAQRSGHARVAIDSYVAAAAGYQQLHHLDAALDACQRALGVALGAPAVHLQMARIYFQRGWHDRAAERMLLLDRLLEMEDDPVTRDGLRELARLNQVSEPRLARLAGNSGARP
jgi:tetratricopeptide (TPR) repeat protein